LPLRGMTKVNKFKFITLRDIPHEFIITVGDHVWLSDLGLFFDFNLSEWSELDQRGLTLTHYRHFPGDITLEDLAVALQMMPSKGQARKNWIETRVT